MDFTLPATFAQVASDVAEIIRIVHPAIYHSILFSCALGCLTIRFGPPAMRPYVAGPFAPFMVACLWMGSHGRPELFALSGMALCPLLMWGAKAFDGDPMKAHLMDSGDSSG